MTRSLALNVLFLLALVAPAAAASWEPGDVAAAEQYRALERERAVRYRAAAARSPAPEPTPRARSAALPPAPVPRAHAGWLESAWAWASDVDVTALQEWMGDARHIAARLREALDPWLRLRARFEAFVEGRAPWATGTPEEP